MRILQDAYNITIIQPPWIHQPQVDLNIILPLIAIFAFLLAGIFTWFALECGLIQGRK